MDFRQYDPSTGRFYNIDLLAETTYNVSPYHFAGNNPVLFGDPSGLRKAGPTSNVSDLPAYAQAMWHLTPENGSTLWKGDGYGNFETTSPLANGMGGFINREGEYIDIEFTYSGAEILKNIVVSKDGRYRDFWGNLGDFGARIRGNAYSYSKYYQHWRDKQLTQKLDDTQLAMEGLALGDPTGAVVDFVNAIGYGLRGQWSNAGISAIAMIPFCDVVKATRLAKVGTTVLGHYPEYVKLAESIGATRFQIPSSVWNKMSAAEQWTANTKFLDRMISRGDDIMLATPLNQVKQNSFFARELEYLYSKGYKVSSDGLWLIK